MAIEGSQPLKISAPASADLIAATVNQYVFVKLASTNSASHFAIGQLVVCSADDPKVLGVNQTHLPSTQLGTPMCEVVVIGRTKLALNSTLTVNTHFYIGIDTNGFAKGVAAVTGGSKTIVGPWFAAVGDTGNHAANDLISSVVNCLTPIPTGN